MLRVLAPAGHLLVVRPAPDHLEQLRAAVPAMVGVDPRKEERLRAALDPLFTTVSTAPVRFEAALDAAAARDLVAMTPSARHVDEQDLDALLTGSTEVTVSVVVSLHRRR